MRALRQSSFTRYVIIPITLVALFSGCYKWSEPSQSPADFIRWEGPSKVRLTLTGNRQVVIEHPTVTDSTISGQDGDYRWVIPSGEIEKLEQRRVSVPATVGMSVLGLVLVGATVFVVAASVACSGGQPCFGGFNTSPMGPGIEP